MSGVWVAIRERKRIRGWDIGFFFRAVDGIRDFCLYRGLGGVCVGVGVGGVGVVVVGVVVVVVGVVGVGVVVVVDVVVVVVAVVAVVVVAVACPYLTLPTII